VYISPLAYLYEPLPYLNPCEYYPSYVYPFGYVAVPFPVKSFDELDGYPPSGTN
jgi:hypothetical protein